LTMRLWNMSTRVLKMNYLKTQFNSWQIRAL
jgi:hypothetical protein